MRTIKTVEEMKTAAGKARSLGLTIGLVPTMGSLHEGHLSLVRESKRRADTTVVSIFVNPLQFGPQEDFSRYPRNPARDAALLEKEGVDILFQPGDLEIYPEGFRTTVEVRGLQDRLCGRSRPGHFKGVTTIVLKLFNIVWPDLAIFGQKDAQQAIILLRMAEDLNLTVKVEALPIVRESDGLAMSSRNAYLNPDERRAALVLFRSLEEARRMSAKGEKKSGPIREQMLGLIRAEPLAKVDYVEIVDPRTLEPIEKLEGDVLVAVAVFVGGTRLIDNVVLEGKKEQP